MVCSLFGRSRGVLPLPAAAGSSFLLAPQLASGFNTNHTSTTTAAFAKTATLHPLASSLDGLQWKKRRLGVVYNSLAGRRTAGSQQRPLAAVVSEAVGAIHFRRRSKQTKQRKKMLLLLLLMQSMLLKNSCYNMVRP